MDAFGYFRRKDSTARLDDGRIVPVEFDRELCPDFGPDAVSDGALVYLFWRHNRWVCLQASC
jgi:hypothetical protein